MINLNAQSTVGPSNPDSLWTRTKCPKFHKVQVNGLYNYFNSILPSSMSYKLTYMYNTCEMN